MPRNNTWAVIGALITTIAVFVLTDLLTFFNSGAIWPVDVNGWTHLIVPSIVAGALAAITPHYSVTEQKTGLRIIDSSKDTPVLDINPKQIIVPQPQPPFVPASPANPLSSSPEVPPANSDTT